MAYALSILEKSPIADGESAARAGAHAASGATGGTLGLSAFLAGGAPQHAAARLPVAGSADRLPARPDVAHSHRLRRRDAATLQRAYKVAENFNLLAALAPGRVDLGVGKAPGGLPLATRALQAAHDRQNKPAFPQQLSQLTAYLNDDAEPGLSATPLPPHAAQRFLLGASKERDAGGRIRLGLRVRRASERQSAGYPRGAGALHRTERRPQGAAGGGGDRGAKRGTGRGAGGGYSAIPRARRR